MGTARVTYVINEKGVIDELIEKVNTKAHSSQILKEKPEAVKSEGAKKTQATTPSKKMVAKKTAQKTIAAKKK
jgi:peroxiredoxin Q/BCP